MKKLNSISLFTGIGGFDKGVMKAGFNSVYQSDIYEGSQAAFLNSHINKNLYPVDDYRNTHGLFEVADIRHQSSKTISDYYFRETKHSMPNADLVLTGSVCQNISAVNPKRNNFNGKNRLIIHQLRVINDLKPKVALFEQVTGLNHFIMKPLRKLFESNLDSMNYYSWHKKVFECRLIKYLGPSAFVFYPQEMGITEFISEALGHSSMKTTQSYLYANISLITLMIFSNKKWSKTKLAIEIIVYILLLLPLIQIFTSFPIKEFSYFLFYAPALSFIILYPLSTLISIKKSDKSGS